MSQFGSVPLKSISKVRMGKTILSKELVGSGIPVYSAGASDEPWGYVTKSDVLFGEETLVISARGNIGLPKLPRKFPFVCTQTTIAISLNDSDLRKYLYYFLQSLDFSPLTSQTTIPMIRVSDINEVVLPLLDQEQRSMIVAEIEKQFSRLDEAVAGLKRVKANLKRYKAAVLKAAVEGRLVPTEADLARRENRSYETGAQLLQRILETRRSQWQGKKAYQEPAEPRDEWVSSVPEGWAVATLESVTSANRVICYGILMPKENVADGVLFVKVRDIKNDKVVIESLHRTTQAIAASYARASLRAGDLLLSIRGTFGRVATVPPVLEGGNITQDTVRLDVSALVDADYLALFLRSDDAQRYFKAVARGVAVKGVNVGDLRPMAVPLPPVAEQHRIVAEVDRLLSIAREAEAEVVTNLKRAQALRQAVLSKSFQGAPA